MNKEAGTSFLFLFLLSLYGIALPSPWDVKIKS